MSELNNKAFNCKNYANILNSFVDNIYKEAASETVFETSADRNSLANKLTELNHVRNELSMIENRFMEHDNSERLKNCQSLIEKEATILTSLNVKLLFLHEEVQQIKLALFSFRHKKALLIPKEVQKDFLKTVGILSDFNDSLEKVLVNRRGNDDGNLNDFIEVFEKDIEEIKQAMCVLSKTYSEMRNKNMIINNLTTTER